MGGFQSLFTQERTGSFYCPHKVSTMADALPYIIVDNQRISPIGRSQRSDSATAGRSGDEEQTFGVVDRVTISTEAREKYRYHLSQARADSPTPDDRSNKSPVTHRPLLAYSPKPQS